MAFSILFGSKFVSTIAIKISRIHWRNEVSRSLEKQFASGASSSELFIGADLNESTKSMATPSTLMRFSPLCRTIHINGKQRYLWRAVEQNG